MKRKSALNKIALPFVKREINRGINLELENRPKKGFGNMQRRTCLLLALLWTVSVFCTGCPLLSEEEKEKVEEWVEENVNVWTPDPQVKSPRGGHRLILGEQTTFKGSAWDLETGLLAALDGKIKKADFYLDGSAMLWTSDKDGQIGTGTEFQAVLQSPGMHEISLTAEDEGGKSGTIRFSLYVAAGEPDPNTDPVATIIEPNRNSRIYNMGDSITFEGYGSDLEQGLLSGEHLVWTSDIDGTLGTGSSFITNSLSEGSHTITLFALEKTDAEAQGGEAGLAGTASIALLVNALQPPTVTIVAPESGTVVETDQSVTFSGNAACSNGDALETEDQMVWESSIDGPLGTGSSIESTLTEGVHTITLTVKESNDEAGTEAKAAADIVVAVVAPAEEPIATIASPINGSVLPEGTTVTLEGYGRDAFDNPLTEASLIWRIDEVEVGTGTGPIELTDIVVGTHSVTLEAIDADGYSGVAAVAISIVDAESTAIPGMIKGAVKAAGSQLPLEGVSIQILDSAGTVVTEGQSNADGLFTEEAAETTEENTYSISFELAEYEPVSYHGITVVGQQTTGLQTVYLTPITPETGSISGQVVNALTGHGVEGLTINLRAGLNNLTGDPSVSISTMDMGGYEIGDLLAGQYTAEIPSANIDDVQYTSASFTVTCVGGELSPNQNGTVTPVMSDGEYRIILTWGEMPSDLDSHLTGMTTSGELMHLYYPMSGYSSHWPEDVNLDLDDITRYGPETTTVYRLNAGQPYVFYVHDYSNKYYDDSTKLAESDAKVEVYKGSTLLNTYYVPQGVIGTLWTVFEIDPGDGGLHELGTMSNASSPPQIGGVGETDLK